MIQKTSEREAKKNQEMYIVAPHFSWPLIEDLELLEPSRSASGTAFTAPTEETRSTQNLFQSRDDFFLLGKSNFADYTYNIIYEEKFFFCFVKDNEPEENPLRIHLTV